MMPDDETLERMLEMVMSNSICVLATASPAGEPHASLMAYVSDPDARCIYMVTLRDTRKFRNIIENPVACLLIRDDSGEKALTLSCSVETVQDPEEENRLKTRLAALRPGISQLTTMSGVSALKFTIKTLLLLEGPVSSSFSKIVE